MVVSTARPVAQRRRIPFAWGLSALILALAAAPGPSQAQSVTVSPFRGKMKKMQIRLRKSAVDALKRNGVQVVPYKLYLRRARVQGIRPRNALKPHAVKKVAKQMKLDGVLAANASRVRKKYVVKIRLLDRSGKAILKVTFRLKRPKMKPKSADKLANLVVKKLRGAPEQVAAAGEEEGPPGLVGLSPPADNQKAPAGKEAVAAKAKTSRARKRPRRKVRIDRKKVPVAKTEATQTQPSPKDEAVFKTLAKTETLTLPATTPEPLATDSGVMATAPPRLRKGRIGPVPDVLLAAGVGTNYRRGLHPKHQNQGFVSVRVDTRVFLGALVDASVVRDIGLGGMYQLGMGLDYGITGQEEAWEAAHNQWQGELVYRLALNRFTLAPTFLFRFGYGSTSCLIPSDDSRAISAGYNYPYAALDIHLMLYEPLLRLMASAGYLVPVSGWGDLEGSGSGFTVQAGFELDILEALYVGFGYDLFQFIGLKVGDREVSDLYQSFFLRVGWNYH